jgi:hypothetical protein
MNERIRRVADAILYEGYILYPYRPSSAKNRQRWTFGVLYPPAYAAAQRGADRAAFHCQCLIDGAGEVGGVLRFLQIETRGGWQEGIAREVPLRETAFAFDADRRVEGRIRIALEDLASGARRLAVEVENTTPFDGGDDREAALPYSLVSAHLILGVDGGFFVSLLDPPPALAPAAAACRNEGVFPVLAGERGSHEAMLVSPIILYDWPELAPESPGDLFDATEIDEILSLRILTLTDDEKREAAEGEGRARQVIERTAALTPDELRNLHGAIRRSE